MLDARRHDLVVRARRALVDGGWREASVVVRDGRVVAIGGLADEVDATVDVTLPDDQVLLPGVVDSHVHVNEPGRTEWEGFATATRAAAAGGVTTIVDMPLNSIPPTTSVDALDQKRAAAGPQSVVDVGFWGGAIPANLGTGDLRALHEAGVFGFKAFLSPSGVDEFPHLSTEQLHVAMAELADFDGLLIVHAEDPERLDAASAAAPAGGAAYDAFVRSRPDVVELTAIEHVVEALRATGGRAHVLHLSSATALDTIRAAKADGLRLTVETCPHYLTFDAEHIGDGATQFKCCPPIRGEANRELLWQGLVDGTIDVVASDHSPSTRALKFAGGSDAGHGDFDVAWGGISGLELSFRAVWTGARQRGIALETVVGWMSRGTAALVGLPTKGRIGVGADADLVAFAPETPVTVDVDDLSHRNPVTAYDDARLIGEVAATWVGGRLAGPSAPPARLLVRPDTGLAS
ncbi:allantoinase AllB [Frigoribacterium sp. PhB24]|uniref:allantoinase AllB n=1 Tax=Frigoribacterium sp. PhB24 TaxID=2485204 RepID=UPI000F4A14FD|nr:allantoinase AllB [Frigoribacterium sp. PhB24]ROS50286.1 allantoinase [Frigoribacterium sp. PhB24]